MAPLLFLSCLRTCVIWEDLVFTFTAITIKISGLVKTFVELTYFFPSNNFPRSTFIMWYILGPQRGKSGNYVFGGFGPATCICSRHTDSFLVHHGITHERSRGGALGMLMPRLVFEAVVLVNNE